MSTVFGEVHEAVRKTLGLSVGWSVVLIVLGILAIIIPDIAGLAVATLFAWLVILVGVMHLVHAFAVKGVGSVLWKLALGVLFIVGGGYILMHPLLNLASLTLLLAVVLFVEGVFHIVNFFQNRKSEGAGWLLLDGILTLVLGFLIWAHWPSSAMWAIGLIVGVDILITGVTRLMLSLALKKRLANPNRAQVLPMAS